jgi:hypothetical protein
MKHRKILTVTATVAGIVVAIIGGYIYWQYRTSRPPQLTSIPAYTSEIPIADVLEPQRTAAEQELRDLASTVRPGYHVAEEQFHATNVEFIWDALRHDVQPYLGSAGYILDKNGDSTDYTMTYSAYRHHGLRQRFNNDVIVAAGFDRMKLKPVAGDEVYVYGYFRLSPL